MAWKPHWNPKASKEELANDISESMVNITGDQDFKLRHWQRISLSDLNKLAMAFADAEKKIGEKLHGS